jgi:hypothetical protein
MCLSEISIVSTLYQSSRYLKEFHRRMTVAARAITDDYELIVVTQIWPQLHDDDGLEGAEGERVFPIDATPPTEDQRRNDFRSKLRWPWAPGLDDLRSQRGSERLAGTSRCQPVAAHNSSSNRCLSALSAHGSGSRSSASTRRCASILS